MPFPSGLGFGIFYKISCHLRKLKNDIPARNSNEKKAGR
jgi:hypothetical protein